MTRTKIAVLSALLLLLTTPVWTKDTTLIQGFPTWAALAIVASVTYAILVAILVERYWSLMAGDVE